MKVFVSEEEQIKDRQRRRRELALDIERQVGKIEKALQDLKETVQDLKSEETSGE